MKMCIKNSFVLPLLVAGLGGVLSGQVSAQTFTTLYSFTGGSDGAVPFAGLLLSGDTLYGTVSAGGKFGAGAVFSIKTDGTSFTNLHSFTVGDGGNPRGGLITSGTTLYGTTVSGGSGHSGTVFSINVDGTSFTNIYSFTAGTNGANPYSGLVLSSNVLYGTTQGGFNYGTLFAVNANGSDFTIVHYFQYADGYAPDNGLVMSGDTLYGVTPVGGSGDNGTVFSVRKDGTSFTVLHNFTPTWPSNNAQTNQDGIGPLGDLLVSGNRIFGTAASGGNYGYGTVFALNTDGTGFVTLYDFDPANIGGVNPQSGLILSGRTLYGTALYGGSGGNGTCFSVGIDGTDFETIHSFSGNADGTGPSAVLTQSGNVLFGTTSDGGLFGHGTIFSISLLPQLTITRANEHLVVSWPTNYAGFDYSSFTLQSSTNLASPVWTTNLPAPIVENGQYTFTNAISGSQQFFRLSQ